MTHIPVDSAQHLAQEVLRRFAHHVDSMERELRRAADRAGGGMR